jgi:nitroreductase
MVRRYDDRPVPPETLTRLLHDATRAPSAGHTQAVELVLLEEPEDVAGFWSVTAEPGAANRWLDGMRSAPVVVVPVTSREAYLDRYAEPDKGWSDRDPGRWPVPYWYVDAGMVALLVLQGAVDAGLGACLFGIPADRVDALSRWLGLPAGHEPIGAITVGHPHPEDRGPTGSPGRRARRDPGSRVHRGRW